MRTGCGLSCLGKEVEIEILYCDLDYGQVMEMNITKRLAPDQKLMLILRAASSGGRPLEN
jgi:hypothetical protein